MGSSAVLPTNGTFLGAQTKELGLEKLRAVIPVCNSCRISLSPAGLDGQVLSLILVLTWAEPALLPGSGRFSGSSLLSKISSLTTPCIAERSWEREQTRVRVVEETWRLFRLLVGFLYWILGASISSSPPFFRGRLSIILAETQAPSTGNLQVILDQQQIISVLSRDCW